MRFLKHLLFLCTGLLLLSLALKVSRTSYSIVWSKNIHLIEGAPDGTPPDIEVDRIYLLDSNNDILAFKATTGGDAESYRPQVAATMIAFRLIL